MREKKLVLPKRTDEKSDTQTNVRKCQGPERPGVYPCPCCGCRTFPVPAAEALAYICPVCMWENDLFTASDDEPSDENHGLPLDQGRENYRKFAVCDPRLAEYARPPRPEELPGPDTD